MKNKILKIGFWIAVVFFVIITILYILGTYEKDINQYFEQKKNEKILEQAEAQRLMYLNLQKNDTYGGATPEETLDLYIKALKAGDIELASKYSEISLEYPDLQEKEVIDLKNVILRDGNLMKVIENTEKIKNFGKKNIWSESEVSFVYYFVTDEEIKDISVISREEIVTIIPIGTELHMGDSLRLNPYTKVWKIIQ